MPPPFVREGGKAGVGPAVICLHSNASTSGQWRGLIERLAPTHHVLAPDSWGAGKSPDWPSASEIRFADEIALIEPVLQAATPPWVLVGHSYGGAMAVAAALRWPERVRAMVLYEPTLFALLDAEQAPPNAGDGIHGAVARALAALQAGDRAGAAREFIDYWMGAGSWDAMPASRQVPIAESVTRVGRWSHACMSEPTTVADLATLQMPVLYLQGEDTTETARGVTRLVTAALPNVHLQVLPGLGHMGPVTHPDAVNDAVARFLSSIE